MALTDLDRQWLHLTFASKWCAGRSSVTPQIAGGQTSAASKQCSAYWTLSDFPCPIFRASLMTSGGQRRAGPQTGPHSPQEAVDFWDPKKTPKQACRRVCQQENTQRKAPGSSARCLQGPRDTLRLCVLLPILTHCVSLLSDVLCACHWLYPSSCHACLFKISKTGIIICAMELWDLGCNQSRGMHSFPPVFCKELDRSLIDGWLHKHVHAWLGSCCVIKSGYSFLPGIPNDG